ncbi:Glycopeptide antibiotics resistance protein [Streptomyces sp. yr375]|uniref:VanZ family protein n=1 Tax=Streptomyces sp. yr375 TaxID=1761906 RepID=UPI0008B68F3E|nr:VanZ family protein [Streptomyces sp. yr375]SEQ36180.1 Glycopeptide antibiotics resistance protein [Streptomyces sp. yr375]
MIEASIKAVPGLIVTFLILAALVAVPTALIAKARNKPWRLRTALTAYLVGIVTVTLLPGDAGLESGQCDTGMPAHLFTSTSSLLNIALFAPGAFLTVLQFKRPATVAVAFGCLSGAVELIQSFVNLGRSCSVTDLAANTTGAALGSLAGALWLHQRRQSLRKPVRDLLWGTSLALVGTVALGGVFHSRVDSVDIVAIDDQRKNFAESAIQADEWINTAAKGIYGSDTQVRETTTEKRGKRLKITAETNRGSIAGWWPEKDLESAWSSNTRGDEGSFSKKQVATAADKFARMWFPRNVAGSKQQIRSVGDGPTHAYVVAYRRYTDGVLLPMRLDLTVTTTGRVIGFTARAVDDPALPSVTVDEAKARDLAEQATGLPTDSTLLLAQQIKGEWRPVWLVGSGKRDVAIDAATGELIPGSD